LAKGLDAGDVSSLRTSFKSEETGLVLTAIEIVLQCRSDSAANVARDAILQRRFAPKKCK
jgi:hypothetical protein